MSHIIEDGTGIYEANSYAAPAYVRAYLSKRGRLTDWDAVDHDAQDAAVIVATDYIDQRFGARFLGDKEFLSIEVAASNFADIIVQPQNNDTVTIGTTIYTFTSAAPSVAYEVLRGADAAASATALISAINADPTGSGILWGVGTVVHPDVEAIAANTTAILIKALVTGDVGNGIVTIADDHDSIEWDYTTLLNGSDSEVQLLEWPRRGIYVLNIEVRGIPVLLKNAMAEYALRALSAELMPDPTVADSGQAITRFLEKVGPIVEETVFGSGVKVLRPYPSADRLLRDYLKTVAGAIR